MKKNVNIYRIVYADLYALALFLFVPLLLYLLDIFFVVALHTDYRMNLVGLWGIFGMLGDYMVFNDVFVRNKKEAVTVSGLLQSSFHGKKLLQKSILADALRRFLQLCVLMVLALALMHWSFLGSMKPMTAAEGAVLVLSVYLGNTLFLNFLRYIHTFTIYWISVILCCSLWELINAVLFALVAVTPELAGIILAILAIAAIAATAFTLWHISCRYDRYFGKGEKYHA